jgi:predicted nucleotidyltransferase
VGRREVGLDAVDPRYAALYDRARDVFVADPRLLRVELHGSVATNTADQWSDLDLKVIVGDEDHKAVVEEWESFLDAITPTVFKARPIAPFVINTVTADGLTFDVSFWPESMPEFPLPTGLGVGLLSGQRFHDYPSAVTYAVQESLRGMSGPLPKFLHRGEHVAHFSGLGHSLSLLQAVLLAEQDAPINARKPATELSPSALAVIEALPAVTPTFDDLLAFELAIGEGVITIGRKLFADYGLTWPSAFEAVAARSLRDKLGVTVDWLSEDA